MSVPLDETVPDALDRQYRRAKNRLDAPLRPLLDALIEGKEFCLNAEQLEGLLHHHDTDGPCLILAGAGSGKTAVMTRRIVYLYLQGYDPEDIFAVTFTNKAAREMTDRVDTLLTHLYQTTDHGEVQARLETLIDRQDDAWLGTFHSLGKRLLEWTHPTRHKPLIKFIASSYSTPIHLLEPDDQSHILETVYHSMVDGSDPYDCRAVYSQVETWRRHGLRVRQARREADNPYEETAARLYRQYQREKRHRTPPVCDFQDLLVFPARLLREKGSVRTALQSQFAHVLIDEFQDTNPVQFTLANQLADEHGRLFAVGDDAQAIYGWRGADIRHIQKFEHRFPEATTLRLSKNYRSSATIVMGANEVFEDDPLIDEKALSPAKGDAEGLDYGKNIAVLHCHSDREERGWLAYEIERLVQQRGYKYGDIAVFYRTHTQKDPIVRYFDEQAIPHVELGQTGFFDDPVVHVIRCGFRLLEGMILHQRDGDLENLASYGQALEGWLSRPNAHYDPGIHDTLEMHRPVFPVMVNQEAHDSWMKSLCETNQAAFQTELDRFQDWYQRLADGATMLAIYQAMAPHLSFEAAGPLSEFTDDVRRLCADWIRRTQTDTGLRGVIHFLESVKEQTQDPHFVPGDPDDFVKMTTLHGAKGLEFPVVLMCGLEETVLPYKHPDQPEFDRERLREEKRLFYVGITRAQERLVLTRCDQREWFGDQRSFHPSRFLDLLPEDLTVEIEPPRSFLQRLAACFIR